MGIRMLRRRTTHAWTQAWTHADSAPSPPPPPVPAVAAAASTARLPADLGTTLRRVTEAAAAVPFHPGTAFRGRLTSALAVVSRWRPLRARAVLTGVTERPAGSAPRTLRPPRG
jgi:hypothetical protein